MVDFEILKSIFFNISFPIIMKLDVTVLRGDKENFVIISEL